MGWTDVDEPYAAPPHRPGVLSEPGDGAVVDLADRWGSISGAALEGRVDASACERLEIDASVLRTVEIIASPDLEVDVRACDIADSDLSGLRFRNLTQVGLSGCKLAGTDLTSAAIRDVRMERCLLRMTSLRMASLERVAFGDCMLEEVDLYDASLDEVSFEGTTLRAVDADQTRFHHVDLRGALELDLRACTRLRGCLITPDQVLQIAYLLARVAGVSVERVADIVQD